MADAEVLEGDAVFLQALAGGDEDLRGAPGRQTDPALI